MKGFLRTIVVAGVLALALLVPAAGASATEIDFSTHGQGTFDQGFYASSGASFTRGSFVGYIQGDDALVGPIAGTFKPKATSLSATFAPAGQGTATYTLAARGSNGKVLKSTSVTVTQDSGDPETGPFGYVTIDLGTLPKAAASFTLTNQFVRSSFSHITLIEFGVSSVSF